MHGACFACGVSTDGGQDLERLAGAAHVDRSAVRRYVRPVAIQFLCPSCKHPVEVDDEWASQSVECPYCHNAVTAPGESTFAPPESIPQARGLVQVEPPGTAPRSVRANAAAIWALVLSCLWFISFLGWQKILEPRMAEIVGPDGTPEDFQRYLTDQMAEGTVPPWLVWTMLLLCASLVFWVAGLICAIIGLRSAVRRRAALAALFLLAGGVVVSCIP